MKTKLIPLLALLAILPFARAADAAPCCAACAADAKPAAEKSCCADETPAAAFTAKSLYQLDATWTNDAGQPVRLASFHGHPVVVAMFFASCEYACPIIVTEMKRLRDSLPADVRAETRFVLVTFDSTRDTPAALAAYRERMQLDDAWTLLRGADADVQELAMLLGVKYRQDAKGQFSHSNLITILNPEGEIAHQRAGLEGDVGAAARAVTATLATGRTIPNS